MTEHFDNENVDSLADQIVAPSGSAIISNHLAAKEERFMEVFIGANLKSINDTQRGFIFSMKAVQESDEAEDEPFDRQSQTSSDLLCFVAMII